MMGADSSAVPGCGCIRGHKQYRAMHSNVCCTLVQPGVIDPGGREEKLLQGCRCKPTICTRYQTELCRVIT